MHRGEDTAIVRCSGHNHLIHTEGVLDSLGHIVAAEVSNSHLLCALLTQNICHKVCRSGCTSVNRGISNKHTLGLNLVLAPRVVEADIVTEILLQDRAVQRADTLHVQRSELLQERLHLCAILTADVEVVAACLASPILLVAQGAELSEAVSREDNLILLVVCNHHLGPMHHRRHKELQGVRSERERIALLHGNGVLREILTLEELRQHLNSACRGYNLYCRVFVHNCSDTTRVVGLHMLHNEVVGRTVGQSRAEVCEPLVHLAVVGRIHNSNLLVLNKI